MPRKRVLAVDAYNVIDIFRKLGLSFEEIAALGFQIEGGARAQTHAGADFGVVRGGEAGRAPVTSIIGEGKEPKA
jgi:hypothetical protein